MKTKKSLVQFKCEQCGLQSDWIEEEGNKSPFPYDKNWVYIYNVDIKVHKFNKNGVNLRDKHFCSRECLMKFMEKNLEYESED